MTPSIERSLLTSHPTRKYAVVLGAQTRRRLETIVHNGRAPAKKIQHARILLMSDSNHPAGRYHDKEIAAILGLHVNTQFWGHLTQFALKSRMPFPGSCTFPSLRAYRLLYWESALLLFPSAMLPFGGVYRREDGAG